MGIAASQARLNILTLVKADINYRLTMIAQRHQNLALQQAQLVSERAVQIQEYSARLSANECQDDVIPFQYSQAETDYEKQMAELEMASSALDQEQKSSETILQAVTAEEEEVKKLLENNTKQSFEYFK